MNADAKEEWHTMTQGKIINERRKRPRIGIKWKMFAMLICFVSVFAITLWVFEIHMLSFFYQNAQFEELEDTAEMISDCLGDDDLTSVAVGTYAKEYYNDIWVYRIKNGVPNFNYPIAFADGTNDGFGTFLEHNFVGLYHSAVENGGKYIAMVPLKHFKESFFE